MTLLTLENVPQMQAEVRALAKERGAVILAHNYQVPEVQEVADFVGDSLGLSQQAAATRADTIVFCGVHFMAETASILSPEKTVLLPDPDAGCSLADSITAPRSAASARTSACSCGMLSRVSRVMGASPGSERGRARGLSG